MGISIIIAYLLLTVVTIAILRMVNRYFYYIEREEPELYDAILNAEELEKHGTEIARNHVIDKKARLYYSLETRMNKNFKTITMVYKNLNTYVKEKKKITPAAEWLLDNFYIIEEQVKEIRQNLSKQYYYQLPRLKSGWLKGYPRVYAIALELVSHTDSRLDERSLINFVMSYQTQSLLSSGELWAIPLLIRMALIENVRHVCDKIMESQNHWQKAEKLADVLMLHKDKSQEELLRITNDHLKHMETITSSFGEHLLNRLKKQGLEIAPIIRYIDERLSEQHTNGEGITQLEHNEQARRQVSMGNAITGLRFISTLDWTEIFEMLSQVEQILKQDPLDVYREMDFESRDLYRHEIEKLSKKYRVSEIQVARKAIECAAEDEKHVGYFLVGRNKNELKEKLGHGDKSSLSKPVVYIGSIIILTLLLILPLIIYCVSLGIWNVLFLCIVGIILLIPVSDIAISIVNWIITHIYTPTVLPKLELQHGIPEGAKTIVVIPTLLTNEKRVIKLLEQLEEYYLANKEDNLYFALLGDYKDASTENVSGDEAITKSASLGVRTLNLKYSKEKDIFYFFHRKRIYNPSQSKWMGWERKRGALVEFNDLLRGSSDTNYVFIEGNLADIADIKYVITIDADTKLPMEAAKKLIGTITHPLNKAVIDEEKGIVVDGYGLLQPRISVDIVSANASSFSRIFAGQGGIDMYTNAVSDVYQDFFGEGIFTGKGIYDVDVVRATLHSAIPDNTVLSHDLLEGSYIRAGLVTDIELIDSFPARYNAYSMRQHRWVRGDWQLIPWLSSMVMNKAGERIKNPLPPIAKWKMTDNLRRSLSAPANLLLIILAFSLLPGKHLLWVLVSLLALFFPVIMGISEIFVTKYTDSIKERAHNPIFARFINMLSQTGLMITFLPYQAYLMINAITKTLIRIFITKKNFLEWVTAADMEIGLKNDLKSFIKRMWICPAAGIAVLLLSYFYSREVVLYAAVFFIAWALAPYIAYLVSLVPDKKAVQLSNEEITELRKLSRKTWSFFEDFVGALDNYLPPDNYQENPPNGIAHRTSPTNIGLLLIATISARDFGYISTMAMLERLNVTLATIEKMKKWKGHLYNWYDTITLEILRPHYVSTVDSGNFIGYLMTVKQSLIEFLNRPLIDKYLVMGIKDTLLLANEENSEVQLISMENLLNMKDTDLVEWKKTIDEIVKCKYSQKQRWGYKLFKMLDRFEKEMKDYFPWVEWFEAIPAEVLESNVELLGDKSFGDSLLSLLNKSLPARAMASHYRDTILTIEDYLPKIENSQQYSKHSMYLRELKELLQKGAKAADELVNEFEDQIGRVQRIFDNTSFTPLYENRRKLFSIGYNEEEEQLTKSYYDLLASEARQASFVAIAKGDVKKEHWFAMDRTLTMVNGFKGLVSWTGTMFEYIMPLLIMRDYENTLLNETYRFVVRCQKEYSRRRLVPWGVSESGYYSFDFKLNYQYKAFGIPTLGLKRGLINDMVIAPYATLLALMVESKDAYRNIVTLKKEGLEGHYGFYEAIDYTPERLSREKKSNIVRSYMAHHQGMGFIALNNAINENILQNRFHSDPTIKATELLLQEKISAKVIFTKDYKEKIEPFREESKEEPEYSTILNQNQSPLPESHILSNGNYSVTLIENGCGYSKYRDEKWGDITVTRWREDMIEGKSGSFYYIQDVETNHVWSATMAPNRVTADKYKVIFSQDKVSYFRVDGSISSQTEVIVSTEDDVEVRRLSITNHGDQARVLEVTSYFEVVLNNQAADVVHQAFSNLFVKTEFLSRFNSILAVRKPREESKAPIWSFHSLTLNEEILGGIQYETDRARFLGRNHSVHNPICLEPNHPLSNTSGPVLDPIMSLRARVRVQPGQTVKLCYMTGVAQNHEKAVGLAEKYNEHASIERAFELAWTRGQVELNYLNLRASEIDLYRHMISQILFMSPLRHKIENVIKRNVKGQNSLWSYGISGDLPIILISISNSDEIDLVKDVIKAHEYWRLKGLLTDIVILDEDESSYAQPLFNLLQDIVSISHARDIREKPGGIYIKHGNIMPEADKIMLMTVAKIVLNGKNGSLAEQAKLRQNKLSSEIKIWNKKPIDYEIKDMPATELQYFNSYGGFNQAGNEYVIRLNQGINTPAPWVNIISNGQFGFQISESGSSCTWSENSRENKLTLWSNDPVSDPSGEILYIRDDETGELWTMTPQPIRENESYNIRHGFGYTCFEHMSHGINQELKVFVPMNDSVKLSHITLNNTTNEKRIMTLTQYIKPVMGVSDQFTSPYITTEISQDNILLVKNTYQTDFPERITFIDASEAERCFTGDRREFLGCNGILSTPEGLRKEKLSNTVGAGYDPCACLQVKIEIEPNGKKEVVFILGQTKDYNSAKKICSRYRNINEADKALQAVTAYWKNQLEGIKVKTPDPSMDILLNGWLLYQTIACRLWARSAFYQSGGAIGYRDQLQDSMALIYLQPETTKKQILYHSEHQYIEGDVQHWWHPITNKGIRTKFSDDLLWLPYATADYINTTGDKSILKEQLHYLDEACLESDQNERFGSPNITEYKASLYEHCINAIEHSLQFGQHGIPLMGSGDWNDGMSAVGSKGKGESVWLGWFLYDILMKFIPICRTQNDNNRADRYSNISNEIAKALEENAWDGNWYRRAYFDNGVPLGSAENTECKIDSLAQSWAIISNAAKPERVKEAFEAVEHYLIKKDEGLILLLAPPFDEGDLEPGYIKSYLPGVRENGGQYTHAAVWVVMAYAKMGMGDKAWELYNLLNPINHSSTSMEAARYKVEPYVMAADVYAIHPHTGRGGWTWYTGAAGWMYRVGLQNILGFSKKENQLFIDPCIPKFWSEYSIEYAYGRSKYHIKVKNTNKVSHGVKAVSINGQAQASNMILLKDDGKENEVEVEMGYN